MFRSICLAAVCSVALGGAAMAQAQSSQTYEAAVSASSRPAEDVARDAARHPTDILAFAELKAGDAVADIRPGGGYFTRLFAEVAGDAGHVYAFIPNRTMERDNGLIAPVVSAYDTVSLVNGDLDADSFAFDRPLDVVFMSQEYHDFTIPRFGVDVAKMNARVFEALKPGGLYVVIDHQAAAGTGISVAGTLHRIEGAELRRQIEAAGFVFDGESAVLANPADDHSINVFDEAIRGRTDQFVYRFRKPG